MLNGLHCIRSVYIRLRRLQAKKMFVNKQHVDNVNAFTTKYLLEIKK